MSCAHSFGEWCPECIDGLVKDYNRSRADVQRLREALEAVKPFVEAWAKASHMMDGFTIGADGLPQTLHGSETSEDRLLARLAALLETP